MSTYLDCNATTPVEPEVLELVIHYLRDEFGNAASRTHEFGATAKQAVERARQQVADVVAAGKDEVIFTSGATESNNIALLGLLDYAQKTGRKHIVSTVIEHKAVLEPLQHLSTQGFEVTLIAPDESGRVSARAIIDAVRDDTLLVSVMHANNETGVLQPIRHIAEGLPEEVYFHVDAAQTFGKVLEDLKNPRIDLMSLSGHKIFGPKGIGALVVRRRGMKRPPLKALVFGGGHERGLRPGTLPVHLIAGLGAAAAVAVRDHRQRTVACLRYREGVLAAMTEIGAVVNGDLAHQLPHVLNVSIPGVDSEAAIVALKDLIAVSNGSACTSASYDPSHVLVGMGLREERIDTALRLSWCHRTGEVDWDAVKSALRRMM